MKNYKKDFPIFKKNISGYPLVYLDTASTSQKPKHVISTISSFYENTNANVKRGIYPLAGEATQMVDHVREKVRDFINAEFVDEIIFTRNTTEANNLIAYSMSHNISPIDTITTSVLEHHSNFVPWQMLSARTNSLFEVLDISENFEILLSDFKKTKVLALTMASNVLGNIIDVQEIIKKARQQNPEIIVVVDAAQFVPHQKIDVKKINCDFLVFSGHKMYAGMGVGVLYGKKERLKELDPFLLGGQMISEVSIEKTTFRESPDKFEAGTMAAADIASLGAAIDYIEQIDFLKIQKQESEITGYALSQLVKIDNLTIIGPATLDDRIGVISFVIDEIHPHDIAQVLGDNGICVRAGHHCCMPLHKRLGYDSSVRVSLGIYSTLEDIDRLIAGLDLVKKLFKK